MKLHRTNKTPGKTSASTAVRRLALWAERYQKIARLHPLCSCIQSILFPSITRYHYHTMGNPDILTLKTRDLL